jgi:hypothetical protein
VVLPRLPARTINYYASNHRLLRLEAADGCKQTIRGMRGMDIIIALDCVQFGAEVFVWFKEVKR